MKSIIRAFAISLVVTGAFASAHLAHSTQGNAVMAKTAACPPPMCPYNSPDGCGIGSFGN